MMTQERIDYFLQLPKGEITEEEFEELKRDYFKANKTSWYIVVERDGNEIRKWDIIKVEEFWILIRKHIISTYSKSELFNFQEFIFPCFEDVKNKTARNFWEANETKEFRKEVYWDQAVFLGNVNFHQISFLEKVTFTNVTFDGNTDFRYSIFKNKTSFNFSSFLKKIDFSLCKFTSDLSFNHCKLQDKIYLNNSLFESEVDFWGSTFFHRTDFSNTEFISDVFFTNAKFLMPVYFTWTLFSKKVDFTETIFEGIVNLEMVTILSNIIFKRTSFLKPAYFAYSTFNRLTFDNINSLVDNQNLKAPTLMFQDIDFNNKTKFSRFNISNISFKSCDITYLYFNLCNWDDTIKKGRLFFSKMEKGSLQNSENQYRQLKQNFTKIGNWELAGYAYVSEMEMRKKRLWKEGKYFTWFFYAFYKYLGGYTQDFIRPIVAMLGSFVFFSLIYLVNHDLIDSMQMSISASIPYIEVQEYVKFEGYWLIVKNVQFVLSVTLLSFFVLALRKRFKL